MNPLKRLCVAVVLGVAALFSAAPAAKAVEQSAVVSPAAGYGLHVAGPFATYGAASDYEDYLQDHGYDTAIIYRYGHYWVIYR